MRFGIFREHQQPRPWTGESALTLFQDVPEQRQLADELGIERVWEVERHKNSRESGQ